MSRKTMRPAVQAGLGLGVLGLGVLGLGVLGLGALGLALLPGGPALAQPRPAAPPPAPPPAPPAAPGAPAPERTTAQFGDWMLSCVQPAGAARVCEVSLTIEDQSRQASVTLGIGRIAKDQPLRLVARVPLGVRVAEPIRLVLDPPGPVQLPYVACTRAGCFAELELRDDAPLRRLRARAADSPARLEWRDVTGAAMAMAVSVRGFAGAMDALGRETGG